MSRAPSSDQGSTMAPPTPSDNPRRSFSSVPGVMVGSNRPAGFLPTSVPVRRDSGHASVSLPGGHGQDPQHAHIASLSMPGMLCAINGQLYAMTPVHSGNMPSGQYGQYAMAYNPVGQGPRGGAAALGVAPQVHLAMGASMGGQMVPGLMYAPMQLPGSQLGGYSVAPGYAPPTSHVLMGAGGMGVPAGMVASRAPGQLRPPTLAVMDTSQAPMSHRETGGAEGDAHDRSMAGRGRGRRGGRSKGSGGAPGRGPQAPPVAPVPPPRRLSSDSGAAGLRPEGVGGRSSAHSADSAGASVDRLAEAMTACTALARHAQPQPGPFRRSVLHPGDSGRSYVGGPSRLFAIDVECVATGVTHNDRSVAQIAIVDEFENVLLNVFVKPSKPVVSYLTPLTGLTPDLLDTHGVPFEEAVDIVKEHLPKDAVLLGYNVLQDVKWLGLETGKHYGSMRDLLGCWPVWNERYGNYSVFPQDHVVRCLLGWNVDDAHDAVVDCIKSIRLWRLFADICNDPQQLRAAQTILLETPVTPSFAKRNPTFEGVCMGNRRSCTCDAPFFSVS